MFKVPLNILILSFFGILFYFQLNGQESKLFKQFFYSNGNVSSEGYMQSGKPTGLWTNYYEDGVIKSIGKRTNFELDSTWIFFDEFGDTSTTIFYVDGKKNGILRTYDTYKCVLVKEESFVDDLRQGYSYTYYPEKEKKLYLETMYMDNLKDGREYEFAHDDGRIIAVRKYHKGEIFGSEYINQKDSKNWKQGKWKTFYGNGKLKTECRYKDDQLNGYYKLYDPDGRLREILLYIDGQLDEQKDNHEDLVIEKEYNEIGELKAIKSYNKEGKKEGTHKFFELDNRVSAVVYLDDVPLAKGYLDKRDDSKEGYWEEFFESGELLAKGEYKEGYKVGKWNYFYKNGQIEQVGFYGEEGKPEGLWVWYYENGSVLREENFYHGRADGELKEYSDSATLVSNGIYIDGEKDGEWFYHINDHVEKGDYRNGLRHGIWHYYFNNGKLYFTGEFFEGEPMGEHKYYYNNGKLKLRSYYAYGKEDDLWKYYNDDGSLRFSIEYKEGKHIKVDGIKVDMKD